MMIIRSYLLRVYHISRSGFETRIVRHENIKAGKEDKKRVMEKKEVVEQDEKRRGVEEREREKHLGRSSQ